MKISIKRYLFFSVLILVSCSKSDIHIDDKFIKEISTIDDENNNETISYIPEQATNLLYLKLNNDRMLCTNALKLQSIYNDYYKNNYQTFYAFLNEVLNQKINININQVQKKSDIIIFDLKKSILNKSNDLIKNEYLKKMNNGIYYFYPKNIPLNQKQTILYKMFIDNYSIEFDDYGGKYIITKYKIR